jgi:hypothetical protein
MNEFPKNISANFPKQKNISQKLAFFVENSKSYTLFVKNIKKISQKSNWI